jgi:acyl-CoA reductase-like NAD-dependent aldehyde dehydrogenase
MLSYKRAFLLAMMATAITVSIELFADLLVVAHPRWMLIDEAAMAILVGALVIVFERWRARHLAEQLRIIRDVNRHVRNELQVLVAASHGLANGESVAQIERAIDHIDWTLREVLPGKVIPKETTPPMTFPNVKFDRPA